MKENLLPEYYHLLLQANMDSEEADNYDVYSEDSTNLAKWKDICEQSKHSQMSLINFVYTNYDTLKQQIE